MHDPVGVFCSISAVVYANGAETIFVLTGMLGVYISVNTICDMGVTCCNVLGDLACAVAMKRTVKIDKTGGK